MLDDPKTRYFEERLILEIDALQAQITQLEAEKSALQRQLQKVRREEAVRTSSGRKNSGNRILVEAKVQQALGSAKRPLSIRELYLEASSTVGNIREPTFRSYVHRMKERGIIKQPRGRRSYYELA